MREIRFLAAVHSIETGEEKNLATFYIMNTSLNRGRWLVSDKALEDALPTLMNKPLGCGPDYRIDDHYPDPMKVGRFVKVEKPNGYALGKAEITDDYVWEKLSAGEWGPISVVILSYRETCTICGKEITGDPWGHEHIESGEGFIQIESFKFDRVDLIDVPSYPQAGLLALGQVVGAEAPGVLFMASAVPFEETVKAPEDRPWDADAAEARVRSWAGGPNKESISWSKYRRAFAWYDRSSPEEFGSYKLPHHDIIDGRLSVVWRGVAAAMGALLGARGGVDIPEGDRRGVYSHLARHYRQFDQEPPEYHTSQSITDGAQGPRVLNPKPDEKEEKRMEELAELRAELETLKAENTTLKTEKKTLEEKLEAAENPEDENPELKELKEKLANLEDERHQERLDAAVEARHKAGLVKDRKAEAERLKELDDSTLTLLMEDAEKVAERMAKAQPTGPKAKYTPDDKSAFEAAVEETRERLFGHRKEAGN